MKKFYEVQAKCGHVGKGNFFRGTFYVRANSGSEAAMITRNAPRVKHHHKDAILSVREITQAEFLEGKESRKDIPYYACKNIQEQRACLDEIRMNIEEESCCDHLRRDKEESRQARIRRNKIKNKWVQKYAAQEIAYAC